MRAKKMNKKRVIIAGKGASGKDHLRKMMVDSGFSYCVSHTTRPKRSDEEEGIDYYFIKEAEAYRMVLEDLFLEHTNFNSWIYGTSKDEFHKSNLFIMTPSGISQLSPIDRSESLIVYVDVSEEIRRERMSLRKDADDVNRRIAADEVDFKGFSDYDVKIEDHNFKEIPNILFTVLKKVEENS
jgi:guanylate kinase